MQKICSNFSNILKILAISSLIAISFFVFKSSSKAETGINRQINFQGKLVKTDGTNVTNGSYTIVFSLYGFDSGSTAVWTESQSVSVNDGIFQAALGSVTPIPASFNFNWDGLYLGIKVGSDNEMTPRIRMSAVPFAFNAEKVAGLTVQDESGNASTSGILKIPNGKTVSFAGATSFGAGTTGLITLGSTTDTLALTTSGATSVALPTGGTLLTNTIAAVQTITSTQTSGTILGITDSTALAGAIKGAVITLSGANAQDQTGLEFNLSNATGTNLNDIVGTGSTWKVSKTGALTVASCSGCGAVGSTNSWGIVNGLLFDGNLTTDFAIGGNSTASAGFAVLNLGNGGIPTASISGLLTLGSAGGTTRTIGAAAMNNLQLGDGTTGGITFFSASNRLTSGGALVLAGGVTATNFNKVTITQPATGSTLTITDGKTLSIGNSLTLNGTDSTIFTFPSTANGTVLTNNAPTQGITSTQTSGTVLALADSTGLTSAITGLNIGLTSSTNSQNKTGISFDLSGGTGGTYYDLYGTGGTWSVTRAGALTVASCTGCGGGPGGSNDWGIVNGLLFNGNLSTDFAIGGSSTDSAKFSIINTKGIRGTQTASVSGDLVLDSSTAKVQSTKNQKLTIGGDTTGNIDISPNNGSGTVSINGELIMGSKVSGAGLTADCDLKGDKLVWDITTETFSCASDLDLLTLNFAETNIAGTVTNRQMDRPNSTTLNTTWSEIKMPFAGDVVGISVAMSAARTAGTATFAPFKNDATTGFTCDINATYTSINQCSQAAGTDSFVAGDNLDMRYTTASYTPTTSEVAANIWVQMTDGADLAELYSSSDPDLGAKDVVVLDPQMQDGVKKSTKAYQKGVVGVIATKPGMILGSESLNQSGIPVAVALAGRVPVKVSTESGAIIHGDYLTTSSTPGVAMKAVKAGQVIGEAMTDYSGEGVGVVGMFIRNTYYSGSALADLIPKQDQDPPPKDFSKLLLIKMFQEKDGLITSDEDVGLSELFADRIAAGLEIITPRLVAEELDVGSIVAKNASISGTLTVDTIRVNSIEGLEFMMRDQVLSMRDLFGLKASESAKSVIKPEVLSASTVASQTDLSILTLYGLNVEGFATVSADLNIRGSSLIEKALTVIDSVSTSNLLVSDFASFFGNVFFKKSVNFEGRATFNNDTAGFAVVNKGNNSVDVEFNEEYLDPPIVTTSIALNKTEDNIADKKLEDEILNENISYVVTKRTTKGFVIRINKIALSDITFSWTALSIKDAKTQSSNLNKSNILNDSEATKSAAFQSIMNQLNIR